MSFSLQPTPLILAITIAVMLSMAALGWLAWVRSGYRQSILLLELLRLAIIGAISFLLLQPESVQRFAQAERPTVAVLVDVSHSMDTQDVQLVERQQGDSVAVPPVSRRTAAEPLMSEATWEQLQTRFDVVLTPFATDDGGMGTDIEQALSQAQTQHPSLRGVVLASDGDWNTGRSPVEAAAKLRAEKIPVFAIPFGSQSRLPDLELVSFDVPTFGIEGKTVRIPFSIDSSMPRDQLAQLELRASDGTSLKHQVEIKAMGRTSDVVVWKPEQVGDFTLNLSVPVHSDEVILDNNSREAPIAIRQEKLKVLVIDSMPRWEYRFLRNALSRDPGVEVHCLLLHPGLSKVGGGSRDYIPAFPESLEELAQYDVVFLGDVGVHEGQLTSRQCELLVGLVEQQASGLVFMPGVQGNLLSLSYSPLDALLPVVFDESQPNGWGSRAPSHLALTELGRSSLLTKLADTPDENMQVWERLPGFQWHAAIERAKAGVDVLAVHQESSNRYGRIPLVATRTFGAGKVLFMGTDGAWRWRRGVEDLYHYRFWGQVVRWMAYQRNMAKGDYLRIFYSPEQPQMGQTVSLNANVMSQGGEPLSQAEVVAMIVSPSGKSHSVQFANIDNEWGAFSADFVPDEAGMHHLTLTCKENESQLETRIFVQGKSVEQVGRPMRLDVLEELARMTRGEVIPGDNLSQLAQALHDIPEPPETVRRVSLWSHPWVVVILVSMFAVFWIGRKMSGAI